MDGAYCVYSNISLSYITYTNKTLPFAPYKRKKYFVITHITKEHQ